MNKTRGSSCCESGGMWDECEIRIREQSFCFMSCLYQHSAIMTPTTLRMALDWTLWNCIDEAAPSELLRVSNVNPLFPPPQVGDWRLGVLLRHVWPRLSAEGRGVRLPPAERLRHPHQGSLLPGAQTSHCGGLRGPPLPQRVGSFRVVQGEKAHLRWGSVPSEHTAGSSHFLVGFTASDSEWNSWRVFRKHFFFSFGRVNSLSMCK